MEFEDNNSEQKGEEWEGNTQPGTLGSGNVMDSAVDVCLAHDPIGQTEIATAKRHSFLFIYC